MFRGRLLAAGRLASASDRLAKDQAGLGLGGEECRLRRHQQSLVSGPFDLCDRYRTQQHPVLGASRDDGIDDVVHAVLIGLLMSKCGQRQFQSGGVQISLACERVGSRPQIRARPIGVHEAQRIAIGHLGQRGCAHRACWRELEEGGQRGQEVRVCRYSAEKAMNGLDEKVLRREFNNEGQGEVVLTSGETCGLSFRSKDSSDLVTMMPVCNDHRMCLDSDAQAVDDLGVVDPFEHVVHAGIIGEGSQQRCVGIGDGRADARRHRKPPYRRQVGSCRPGEIKSIRFRFWGRLLMRQDLAGARGPNFKSAENPDRGVRRPGLVDEGHAVAVVGGCAVLDDDGSSQPGSKEVSGGVISTGPILLDRYINFHHIVRMSSSEARSVGIGQHVIGRGSDLAQRKPWGITEGGERFESRHPKMMPEATRPSHTWQDPRVNVICDLDGVIWLADEVIAGSAEAVAKLRAAGHRVTFVSNNSFATVHAVEGKLERFGIPASGDVFTSAQAAASLIESGERVLLLGGPGAAECLTDVGAHLVEEGPADVVVVGFHRTFDYESLRKAATVLRAGARFVATNDDATYPTPAGPIPGCGSLVAAVQTGSGKAPVIAGKPYAPMAAVVRQSLGDEGDFIVIGDRADTDGEFAVRLGARFGLVLSGVVQPGDLPVSPNPDLIADDLLQMARLLLGAT